MENNVFDLKKMENVLNDLRCQKDPLTIIGKMEFGKQNLYNRIPQKPLGTFLKQYNKKIDEIQKQNVIKNNKKIEANCKKEEQVKKRLRDLETQRRRKTSDLKKHIENKKRISKKLLAEKENLRLSKKRDNEIKGYFDKVEHQNKMLAKNQLLIDKCIRNKESDDSDDREELIAEYEEEIKDEPLEEMEEEECFIDSDQSRIEEIYNNKDLGSLKIYLERIVQFKKKFGTCEAGRYFLIKTAPLWNSLTQCIYRKSLILEDMAKNSDNAIPEEYKKYFEQASSNEAITKYSRDLRAVNNSFLEQLITDLGYELSDEDVYNAMIKAKLLLDNAATALELMELAKRILQYDIFVKKNVSYIFDGICRRTVFEYAKKRMSYHILGHSKNVINKLRFLNDISLIPKRLLTSKKSEKQVEQIISEFLADDAKYRHLTAGENTITVDDMYQKRAETEMREFSEAMVTIGGFDASSDIIDGENAKRHQVYVLPGKKLLEAHVDAQVGRLMAFVHEQLAASLSRRSQQYNPTGHVELTRDTYNILARKITKMVFRMGGPYEEKIYVLEVIIKKIAIEIVKRSPKVLYTDKNRHNAATEDTKVDLSFFSKRFDILRASKKLIVQQ